MHGAWGSWRPGACGVEGQLELPGEMLEVGAGKGWGGQPLSYQLRALLPKTVLAPSVPPPSPHTFPLPQPLGSSPPWALWRTVRGWLCRSLTPLTCCVNLDKQLL